MNFIVPRNRITETLRPNHMTMECFSFQPHHITKVLFTAVPFTWYIISDYHKKITRKTKRQNGRKIYYFLLSPTYFLLSIPCMLWCPPLGQNQDDIDSSINTRISRGKSTHNDQCMGTLCFKVGQNPQGNSAIRSSHL